MSTEHNENNKTNFHDCLLPKFNCKTMHRVFNFNWKSLFFYCVDFLNSFIVFGFAVALSCRVNCILRFLRAGTCFLFCFVQENNNKARFESMLLLMGTAHSRFIGICESKSNHEKCVINILLFRAASSFVSIELSNFENERKIKLCFRMSVSFVSKVMNLILVLIKTSTLDLFFCCLEIATTAQF